MYTVLYVKPPSGAASLQLLLHHHLQPSSSSQPLRSSPVAGVADDRSGPWLRNPLHNTERKPHTFSWIAQNGSSWDRSTHCTGLSQLHSQPAPGEEQNSQGAETSRVASADPNNSHIRALPAPDATVFSHLQSFATDIHKTLLCKQLTLEHRLQKIQYNPHLTAWFIYISREESSPSTQKS